MKSWRHIWFWQKAKTCLHTCRFTCGEKYDTPYACNKLNCTVVNIHLKNISYGYFMARSISHRFISYASFVCLEDISLVCKRKFIWLSGLYLSRTNGRHANVVLLSPLVPESRTFWWRRQGESGVLKTYCNSDSGSPHTLITFMQTSKSYMRKTQDAPLSGPMMVSSTASCVRPQAVKTSVCETEFLKWTHTIWIRHWVVAERLAPVKPRWNQRKMKDTAVEIASISWSQSMITAVQRVKK